MFLVCLSFGYAISAFFDWQYVIIGIMFILAIIANFII